MSQGQVIETSLKSWLEENLPTFLNSISEEYPGDPKWEMPTIEDYVLVVAVKDFSDGEGGIFSISNPNVSPYRIRGLLVDALNH